MTSKSLKRFSYTVLVGPTILIYGLVIIFPVVVSLVLSFTQWSGFGAPKFVGLGNFITMFKDSVFYIMAPIAAIALFQLGLVAMNRSLSEVFDPRLRRGA